MKFVIFAVLLVLGVVAALAVEPKENLKTAEQYYAAYAAPYAYAPYPAFGVGAFYYGR
ncbi:hypothetical protein R5R35_004307 [Gryllus longicercus]|uniref:Uncharacterized protein n=1 Tax=Gryllus longicercus TaxID=2509291 RepID=A0AAN9Z4A1_9ORTH